MTLKQPLFKFAVPIHGIYEGVYSSLRRQLGNPPSMQTAFYNEELPSETEAMCIDYLPIPIVPSESSFQAIYRPIEAFSIIFQKDIENNLTNDFKLKVNFTKRF